MHTHSLSAHFSHDLPSMRICIQYSKEWPPCCPLIQCTLPRLHLSWSLCNNQPDTHHIFLEPLIFLLSHITLQLFFFLLGLAHEFLFFSLTWWSTQGSLRSCCLPTDALTAPSLYFKLYLPGFHLYVCCLTSQLRSKLRHLTNQTQPLECLINT